MSLTRISFQDSAGGSLYTCPINPNSISTFDEDDIGVVNTLDGSPARLEAYFDNRVKTLEWDYFPTSNTTFTGMVSELKTYKGLNMKLNLQDIGVPLGLNSYSDIKVLNVSTSLQKGGRLMQNIILTYTYR